MIALRLNTAPARRALSPDGRVQRPRRAAHARRPRASASVGAVLVGIAAVGGLGLSYVAETAAATQASYQIAVLGKQQEDLLARQQQIRYQISLATSAGRLDGDAAKMGMVRQGQTQYLPGGRNPVALAGPQEQTPTVAPSSLLDQLAAVLGRPTEAQAKSR
jgi:hypothetical protein